MDPPQTLKYIYIFGYKQKSFYIISSKMFLSYQNSNSSTLYKKTKNVHKTEILAHIIISFINSL